MVTTANASTLNKLRLLITERCNRSCPGCCNKQWDLDQLPVCTSYEGFDEIILTGGEPLLCPDKLISIVMDIKMENPEARIYLYSAKMDEPKLVWEMLKWIDGICLTIHDYQDGVDFVALDWLLRTNTAFKMQDKSLRLNVFKDVFRLRYMNDWIVKPDIEWIKNCPLPPGEIFMRHETT